MVSVALVLMLMLMLATVFSLATASIGDQRGLGQNDQRMRLLTTIIRDDLNNRSMLNVTPFAPGDTAAAFEDTPLAFDLRRGYFYISENDPDDDTDDVLRLTVEAPAGEVYYGKAIPLGNPAQDRNQPEWDDGYAGNQQMTSTGAEVIYFLRRGTLYRRVLLIRQPLDPNDDAQPANSEGDKFFETPELYSSGNFWRDFDLSAHRNDSGLGTNPFAYADVNGSLSNDPGQSANHKSLGEPYRRFGFNHLHFTSPRSGMPCEYVTDSSSGTTYFIGAYTHEETSSDRFTYPQNLANGNPMNPTGTFEVETPPGSGNFTGTVSRFSTGSTRRAEDVLQTGVHSFDIKVWDDGAQRFVDIGGNGAVDFAAPTLTPGGNRNTAYGPGGPPGNRVFDTWHPAIDFNGNLAADDPADYPPYRPLSDPNDPNSAKPLRAIQITIRFHDVTSDQLRQMTLIHALPPVRASAH